MKKMCFLKILKKNIFFYYVPVLGVANLATTSTGVLGPLMSFSSEEESVHVDGPSKAFWGGKGAGEWLGGE